MNYKEIFKIFYKKTFCSQKSVPAKELFIILPYLRTMSSNLTQKLGTSLNKKFITTM